MMNKRSKLMALLTQCQVQEVGLGFWPISDIDIEKSPVGELFTDGEEKTNASEKPRRQPLALTIQCFASEELRRINAEAIRDDIVAFAETHKLSESSDKGAVYDYRKDSIIAARCVCESGEPCAWLFVVAYDDVFSKREEAVHIVFDLLNEKG